MEIKHNGSCLCVDCIEAELIMMKREGFLTREYDKSISDFRYKLSKKGLLIVDE